MGPVSLLRAEQVALLGGLAAAVMVLVYFILSSDGGLAHHRAKPVLSGVKLAANVWLHLHEFRKPNLWGCTGAFA